MIKLKNKKDEILKFIYEVIEYENNFRRQYII